MKLIISSGHKHGVDTVLHTHAFLPRGWGHSHKPMTHGPINPSPDAKLGYVKP